MSESIWGGLVRTAGKIIVGVVFVAIVLVAINELAGGMFNGTRRLIADLTNHNTILSAQLVDYTYQADSLSEALSQAHTANVLAKDDLRKALVRASALLGDKANLMGVIDSLNGEIVSIREGHASVTFTEKGKLVDGHFEDDWLTVDLDARLPSDTSVTNSIRYDSLSYTFEFELRQVSVSMINDSNNVRTIHSAQLVSRRNPEAVKWLQVDMTETVRKPDVSVDRWRWWDPRLSLGYHVLSPPMLTGGIAVASYRPDGGDAEGSVLIRFPVLGLVSDFRGDHRLGAGVLINLAPWIPLVQNLYLQGGYGWGERSGPVVAINVML